MDRILKEKVVSIEKLSESIYRLKIYSPQVAENAKPGQFINIKCCDGLNAFLRRPISICNADSSTGTFEIVFQVKGAGTGLLSMVKPGDDIDFIGPLGKPFDTEGDYRTIAVVGGGIGVFPLLFLLKKMKGTRRLALLGFRNKSAVVLQNEFPNSCEMLQITTDDGSYGEKGLVGDLLENAVSREKIDIVYTCGPTPMLKKIADITGKYKIRCQVSMEQRMGCGIGACLVCACKTKRGEDWDYSHVCKDGPVFWSDEVIFD